MFLPWTAALRMRSPSLPTWPCSYLGSRPCSRRRTTSRNGVQQPGRQLPGAKVLQAKLLGMMCLPQRQRTGSLPRCRLHERVRARRAPKRVPHRLLTRGSCAHNRPDRFSQRGSHPRPLRRQRRPALLRGRWWGRPVRCNGHRVDQGGNMLLARCAAGSAGRWRRECR
jgi:hypothetical protein